jgi:hypothetical protein
VAAGTPAAAAVLERLRPELRRALDRPETYTGRAAEQVDAVCAYWEAQLPGLVGAHEG